MANNALIGALRAEATLESGKFVDGAKKIRQASKQTETQVKTSFNAMGSSVRGFGGALTAGLSIGLFTGLIKKTLDYANSIGDVAKQIGVTAKELQEFRYAAAQVGIAQAAADKGLEQFNLNLSKAASGSKSARKAFGAVGVSLDDIQKKSKIEIFGKIADQMNKQGGAAKNAAAGNAIFGEGFSKLTPLLDRGSKGINELAQAAERLGIVLSDEQIQKADDTARKLDDIRRVLAAQIAGVVVENAQAIVSLAQSLGQLTGAIVQFLASNPTAALGILGALAGSRFGPIGAAAGGLAGSIAGSQVDIPFNPATAPNKALLRHNLQSENNRLKQMIAARQGGRSDPGETAQIRRVQSLTSRLNAAEGRAPSSSGVPPLPQFLAPAPKKGRARKGPRDRSDDTLFQFDQEQRQADMDILRAKQDLAHTVDQRADIALQILALEKEGQDAELAHRIQRAQRDFAEGKITKGTLDEVTAQAEVLKQRNDEAYRLKVQAADEQRADDKRREANAISEHEVGIRQDILQKQASLAETAEERRKIELELLQIAYEQRRKALQDIVDHSKDTVEIANARADLASLNASFALDKQGVLQSTRDPMEDYLASLPTTAAKANEALQRLEVQGFDGLIDSVLALSEGLGAATDSLLETLKNFLLGLARLELQKALGGLLSSSGGILGSSLGGLLGSGGGAAVSSGLGSFAPGASGTYPLLGFAGGGGFDVLGNIGRDRNVLSLNRIPIARVSYGERINVGNDNSPASRSMERSGGNVAVYVNGVTDLNGFNRSAGQIERAWKRKLR